MPGTSLRIERVLTLLAETPTRIAAFTADLEPEELQMRPTPDEWSANEVLAHLRACADVWGNSIMTILSKDQPTWRAVSPRTWIKQTNYPELAFQPSLDAFTKQRADLLAVLSLLPVDAWERSAHVSMVGKVLERTVLSYAERLVVHEKSHIKQIAGIADTMHMRKGSEDG
ncbi:MAG: DinB family protein [Ktedonobacteraceae bacterium]|nr:DinB family protein [Ktedonobacteraceae bacterium]